MKLKKPIPFLIAISLTFFNLSNSAFAHAGRVNKDGCHTDKTTNQYHCHSKEEKKLNKDN